MCSVPFHSWRCLTWTLPPLFLPQLLFITELWTKRGHFIAREPPHVLRVLWQRARTVPLSFRNSAHCSLTLSTTFSSVILWSVLLFIVNFKREGKKALFYLWTSLFSLTFCCFINDCFSFLSEYAHVIWLSLHLKRCFQNIIVHLQFIMVNS